MNLNISHSEETRYFLSYIIFYVIFWQGQDANFLKLIGILFVAHSSVSERDRKAALGR